MNRFQEAEKLAATTREEIPRVAVQWLAAAREPLEKLTMAAMDPDLSDAEFRALAEAFSQSLPGLLDTIDHDALAKLMEDGMGAAMANGIGERLKTSRLKTQDEEKRAKLPWETYTYLAAQRRRKNGQFGEGDGVPSRKQQRRKPTRREKMQADKPAPAPDALKDAAIARYRKGVKVKAPTGRDVTFGTRAADHLAKKEGSRARFADLAENAVSTPDEVWQDGLRCYHVKHQASPGSRKAMLVVTRQIREHQEEVITFTKKNPRELKQIRRGRKIYPAG